MADQDAIQNATRVEPSHGCVAFFLTRAIQRPRPLRPAMMSITRDEQRRGQNRMSAALSDTFSGSAPYSEILPPTLFDHAFPPTNGERKTAP